MVVVCNSADVEGITAGEEPVGAVFKGDELSSDGIGRGVSNGYALALSIAMVWWPLSYCLSFPLTPLY